MTLAQKARILRELHEFRVERGPLVLPNIWDPIGARVLAAKGAPAVATASAAVSASLGYEDGEKIKRSTLIDILRRIAGSVGVPVTADVERGFGASRQALAETTRLVLEAGVAGINLEDSLEEGGELRGIDDQCERIATVRETAASYGVDLVINARVDTFLPVDAVPSDELLDETQTRATAYIEAGADCIYPVGPGDMETVRKLRDRISAPINILGSPRSASIAQLAEIGVNRVSFGPFVFRACLRTFSDIADALIKQSDASGLSDMFPGDQFSGILSKSSEGS